jgi:hypothetical protein
MFHSNVNGNSYVAVNNPMTPFLRKQAFLKSIQLPMAAVSDNIDAKNTLRAFTVRFKPCRNLAGVPPTLIPSST